MIAYPSYTDISLLTNEKLNIIANPLKYTIKICLWLNLLKSCMLKSFKIHYKNCLWLKSHIIKEFDEQSSKLKRMLIKAQSKFQFKWSIRSQ